jgi:hypothetical protein
MTPLWWWPIAAGEPAPLLPLVCRSPFGPGVSSAASRPRVYWFAPMRRPLGPIFEGGFNFAFDLLLLVDEASGLLPLSLPLLFALEGPFAGETEGEGGGESVESNCQ